jgi:hypothetical protein
MPQALTMKPAPSAFRAGDNLVIQKGAQLPPLCVNCGGPTFGRGVSKWYVWRPRFATFLVWWVLLYLAPFLTIETRVRLPMCSYHRRRYRLFFWSGLVLFVVGLLSHPFFAVIQMLFDWLPFTVGLWALEVAAFLLGLALLAIAGLQRPRVVRIEHDEVILSGVSQRFLDSLPGPEPRSN